MTYEIAGRKITIYTDTQTHTFTFDEQWQIDTFIETLLKRIIR